MPRVCFGHCIGCDQPIRPPYLSLTVKRAHGDDGNSISAAELTADDLHRLVSAEEEAAA